MPVAILGVTFKYNSLVLQKHVEIYSFVCSDSIPELVYKKTYCNGICRFIPDSSKCQGNLSCTPG